MKKSDIKHEKQNFDPQNMISLELSTEHLIVNISYRSLVLLLFVHAYEVTLEIFIQINW